MADIIETNRAMNDDTILLIIYFDGNFPNAKLRPYDNYKTMSSILKVIFSKSHNFDQRNQGHVIL
jgi:hypothetical protein